MADDRKPKQIPNPGNWTLLSWKTLILAMAALVVFCGLLAFDVIPGYEETSGTAAVSYTRAPQDGKISVALVPPPTHGVADSSGNTVHLLWSNGYGGPASLTELAYGFCGADSALRELSVTQFGGNPQTKTFEIPSQKSSAETILLPDSGCFHSSKPVVLSYSGTVAGQPFQGMIYTAPFVLSSFSRRWWVRFDRLFYEGLKLLIIPIFLGVATLIVNRLQIKADDRKKSAQDDIVRGQTQLQKENDARNSILRTLIPEYHKLIDRHYGQIDRRLGAIVAEHAAAFPDGGTWRESAGPGLFCAVVLARLHTLRLLRSRGGVFFRSKTGEQVFVECQNFFNRKMYELTEKRENFQAAVDFFKPTDELATAIQKLSRAQRVPGDGMVQDPQAVLLRSTYAEFVAKMKQDALTVHFDTAALSQCILNFECDRPFYQMEPYDESKEFKPTGWYFDTPQLDISPALLHLEPQDETYRKIQVYLLVYLKQVPEKCKSDDTLKTAKKLSEFFQTIKAAAS